MLAILFFVFALIFIAVGGFCGFRRGLAKEGIRLALHAAIFIGVCFLLPMAAEAVPVAFAGRFGMSVSDTEQLAAEFLKKAEFLKRDIYLILPAAALLRSFLLPFLVILFFWGSWLLSGLLYIIVFLFFQKEKKEKKAASKAAGLLLGVAASLFGGMLTLYPVAAFSMALSEGDAARTVSAESAVALLEDSYQKTPVQILYRYTGMEWLAGRTHSALAGMVTDHAGQNFWAELPKAVRLCSGTYGAYSCITGTLTSETGLQPYVSQMAESYFSFGFLSEENALVLLRHLKAAPERLMGGELAEKLSGWIVVSDKEQVVRDLSVYAALLEMFLDHGISGEVQQEQLSVLFSRENAKELMEILYTLSNADTAVPEFFNFLYAKMTAGEATELFLEEPLLPKEQQRESIMAGVDVLCRLSALCADGAELTPEKKREALDAVKELKGNEAIGLKNYTALLRFVMNGF